MIDEKKLIYNIVKKRKIVNQNQLLVELRKNNIKMHSDKLKCILMELQNEGEIEYEKQTFENLEGKPVTMSVIARYTGGY